MMTKSRLCPILTSLLFAAMSFAGLQGSATAEVLPPVHSTSALPAADNEAAQASAPTAQVAPPANPSTLAKISNFTNRASQLALQAVSVLGVHYKYGGNSPESGLDCSGLVRYVFKEAVGKDLPRTAAEISHVGQHVDPQNLQPGDLVFYNTLRRGFSHVGIYLGDNKFIHSPSAGGQVRIESMDLSYWKKRFNGARRIDEQQGEQASQ
jgi:cell wall-associated NlpC family hydrolase